MVSSKVSCLHIIFKVETACSDKRQFLVDRVPVSSRFMISSQRKRIYWIHLTIWPGLFNISFKCVIPHFWQKNCPEEPSTLLRHETWTLEVWLIPILMTLVMTAWQVQFSYLCISLIDTCDNRYFVANHPGIALIFQILPPLFVSRVKAVDKLESAKSVWTWH